MATETRRAVKIMDVIVRWAKQSSNQAWLLNEIISFWLYSTIDSSWQWAICLLLAQQKACHTSCVGLTGLAFVLGDTASDTGVRDWPGRGQLGLAKSTRSILPERQLLQAAIHRNVPARHSRYERHATMLISLMSLQWKFITAKNELRYEWKDAEWITTGPECSDQIRIAWQKKNISTTAAHCVQWSPSHSQIESRVRNESYELSKLYLSSFRTLF